MTDIVARIPIIKLYDNLIVSIQTALSDQVVLQLKDDIANKIDQTGANGLVVDISGVEIMDSYISRAIRDIALIAKLMGVRTVISGMDALVAISLVEMGLSLPGVEAVLNLETAIERLSGKE